MRSNKKQHTLSSGWSAVQHMMNGHSHVPETNSNYGNLKGKTREITGARRLVGREPLEMTRTHACTTSEQSCSCRWGNIQTNNDQRHKRSRRGSSSAKPPKSFALLQYRVRWEALSLSDLRLCPSRQAKGFDAVNTAQRLHR